MIDITLGYQISVGAYDQPPKVIEFISEVEAIS